MTKRPLPPGLEWCGGRFETIEDSRVRIEGVCESTRGSGDAREERLGEFERLSRLRVDGGVKSLRRSGCMKGSLSITREVDLGREK